MRGCTFACAALIAVCASLSVSTAVLAAPTTQPAGPSHVELKKNGESWQLLRNGEPFFIKGAGGSGSRELLKQLGGNSFRTWGVGDDTPGLLDEAQKYGLAVSLGIWIRREGDKGFSYKNPKDVAGQYELARKAIERYKDHPALLMWSIGNEMEGFKAGDDPLVWKAVEDIAALAKQIDPNHPVMTVIAEVGGARAKSIEEICKHVDVVGINSYGGAGSAGERYRKAGGTKPFVITEFGPPGTWEGGKNGWGVPIEFTSTRKGDMYRSSYEKGVLAQKDTCLGSYVFLWAHKNEATPTWYGLFLPDGAQLEGVHVMAELWSGKAPANRCPKIQVPKLERDTVAPGETITAKLDVEDPDGDALKVNWVLRGEVKERSEGGAHEEAAATHDDAIVSSDVHSAQLKMPTEPGTYRLFTYAYDGQGNAAVSNAILRVQPK